VSRPREPLLLQELRWLIRLRWVAGAGVLGFGLLQWAALGWIPSPGQTVALGIGILLYNATLIAGLRAWGTAPIPRSVIHAIALAQILFDLLALTLLAISTGGLQSPAAPFFVFHMVFAALLLPKMLAAACALAAIALFAIGLLATGQLHTGGQPLLLGAGWVVALVTTLYLAERIARALHQRERSRIRLHRRARRAAADLLRQEKAMLQHEKMVAMGQLAAGVAHEINNPLASMDGLLQLIARKPEAALRPGTTEQMREQVERIQTIVRRLTAFAHPDTGTPETVDLAECVRSALRVISFDHRLRRVHIEQEHGHQPVLAHAVARSLQQVLTNLVLNAVDATAEQPRPTLTIRTRLEGESAIIEIADNGPGIAPGHLERIFEPFFTTKPVGQGTGLGLSISRTLLQEQGGELTARSEPGAGATFLIRLRAVSISPAPATEAAPHGPTLARS
jgi:signal transduction histidine kinase